MPNDRKRHLAAYRIKAVFILPTTPFLLIGGVSF
ncbi:MAG: hypothetical protein ACI91R_001711, partial [Vicingaceae bacterium]